MITFIKIIGLIVIFGNFFFLFLDWLDYKKFERKQSKKYKRIGNMLIERKSSDGKET